MTRVLGSSCLLETLLSSEPRIKVSVESCAICHSSDDSSWSSRNCKQSIDDDKPKSRDTTYGECEDYSVVPDQTTPGVKSLQHTVHSLLTNVNESWDSSSPNGISHMGTGRLPHQTRNGRIMDALVKFKDRDDPG